MEDRSSTIHRVLARVQHKLDALDDAQAYAEARLHAARTDREDVRRWRMGDGSTGVQR
jgi:hypothetical protein